MYQQEIFYLILFSKSISKKQKIKEMNLLSIILQVTGDLINSPEAEEIKLFMVSGDPSIYIVPISEIPVQYIKTDLKSEDSFENISLIDFQI